MNASDVSELTVISSIDGAREKVLFHFPGTKGKVPLLVGLHTWSYDRFNQLEHMLPYCRERGWALLLPEFRGPNLTTNPRVRQTCASTLARQDILDAVGKVVSDYSIDTGNIFLLGGSGGGHIALLTAAGAPQMWKGVSAWVPITDLSAWHGENPEYAPHIAACCGGAPNTDAEVDREYRTRSPLSFVKELATVNLSLHHGRYDPVVSYGHSWKLAQELEQRDAEKFFFEIFSGGHEIRYDTAFRWFDSLLRDEVEEANALTG